PQEQLGYLESKVYGYHLGVARLVEQRRESDAFAWAEKAKGRVLRDQLLEGKADLAAGLPEGERAEEARLRSRLVASQRKRFAAGARADAGRGALAALD